MKSTLRKRVLFTPVLFLQLVSLYGNGFDEVHQKESHESSHSEHRHHIAALVGATSNLDSEHTDLTIGGDYQYRLSTRWVVGAFGEAIFAEHTEYILGVPVGFYLSRSLWLRTGPGVEFEQTSGENHARSSSGQGHKTTKAKFLFRFGVGYNFEVGGLTITPSLDIDLVRSANALVWGVSIGKGF